MLLAAMLSLSRIGNNLPLATRQSSGSNHLLLPKTSAPDRDGRWQAPPQTAGSRQVQA